MVALIPKYDSPISRTTLKQYYSKHVNSFCICKSKIYWNFNRFFSILRGLKLLIWTYFIPIILYSILIQLSCILITIVIFSTSQILYNDTQHKFTSKEGLKYIYIHIKSLSLNYKLPKVYMVLKYTYNVPYLDNER